MARRSRQCRSPYTAHQVSLDSSLLSIPGAVTSLAIPGVALAAVPLALHGPPNPPSPYDSFLELKWGGLASFWLVLHGFAPKFRVSSPSRYNVAIGRPEPG